MSRQKLTKEQFIEQAHAVHGDKFDYSLVELDNGSLSQVKIICPEHGVFVQRAGTHTGKMGRGCPKCKNGWKVKEPKLSKEQKAVLKQVNKTAVFVEKAKAVHGDRYDYGQVNYRNNCTKVVVTCKVHGDFLMRPSDHLSGRGCPSCGVLSRVAKRSLTEEEFIEKARAVHGDLYGYEKVNYVGSKVKVVITCNEHGTYRDWETDRKSTRLNSSHEIPSRMPSSA